MGGTWVTTASVSTNNKGWASPGGGQCPPGHPSFPALALASAQSPLSHPLRLGVCPGPPPSCTLPAHIIPSHPKTETRPAQYLSPNHHSGSPLPLCCSQTHLAPGTWLLSPPNPEMAQGGSCLLLSVSWGPTSPTSATRLQCPPSPTTCASLRGYPSTLWVPSQDSRHIE